MPKEAEEETPPTELDEETTAPFPQTATPTHGGTVNHTGDSLGGSSSEEVLELGTSTSPNFEKLRKDLLKEFGDVFKEELCPSDRIKGVQRIEIDESRVKPLHWTTPKEVPCHLRKAADKELKRCLQAGQIEPCHHYTKWLSRGMFVGKASKEGEEVKARLVLGL